MVFLFGQAEVNFAAIGVGVLGGLALFLFGMGMMTDAMKQVAGNGMRTLLARLTRNRFLAAVTGATVTAICQSSSVTTVLLVGFITAGLMNLQQAIGVIMGANIGSTVTAQLIAFKITELALPMITVGFGMSVLGKLEKIKQGGAMIMGLGLVFYGMGVMSESTHSLREYEPFIDTMKSMDNYLLAVIASAIITAIIQSSAATTGIVIVLAGQGFITLEAGIALALGSNIGTCATAVLSTLGKPAAAKQTAAVHVLFNVIGVLIWLPFISQLSEFVTMISPSYPDLDGTARAAAETPRQIANAHTSFNVINTLAFIWFTGLLARLVQWLIPEKPEEKIVRAEPKYLDDSYLETPSLALDRVRMELQHMGEYVLDMMQTAPPAVAEGNRDDLQRIAEMDDNVDILYDAIVGYVRRLAGLELSAVETQRLENWLTVADKLESTGDLIETNLVEQGIRRIEKDLKFSHETVEAIRPLYDAVSQAMKDALQSVQDGDINLARQVLARKPEISALADSASAQLGRRLLADEPNRVEVFRIESDIISQINRLYHFAKRIAKVVAAEQSDSTEKAAA